jgi:hypothetical protein
LRSKIIIAIILAMGSISVGVSYASCGSGTSSTTNPFCPPYYLEDSSNGNVARISVDSSGNVGIGTSSPQALLNVVPPSGYSGRDIAAQSWADMSGVGGGEGLFGGNAYLNNTDNSFHYSNTHGTIGASGFAVNYPAWNEAGIFINNGPSTAIRSFTPNWVATFSSSGNVGIDTTSPASTLDVSHGIISTAVGGTSIAAGYGYGCSGCASYTTLQLYGNNGATIFNDNYPGSNYNFERGGISELYIDSSGNVGIGTSSPAQKLDVSGNLRLSGSGTSKIVSPNNICIGAC